MPQGSRTLVRSGLLACALLWCGPHAAAAATSTSFTPVRNTHVTYPHPDTLVRAPLDTVRGSHASATGLGATKPAADSLKFARDTARSAADSVRRMALDSLHGAYKDSLLKPDSARAKARDTGKRARPNYRWEAPELDARECRAAAEDADECWRREADLADQEIGFPGPRGWTLSLTNWRPLPQESPYFPFWRDSPYLSGGLAPPERFALRRTGSDVEAAEEVWTPVAPLDTPVTSLDWERGAVGLNNFDLKLKRMLSDRVYLGLEYYSATADTSNYTYQFNVHQPYLGGWGFLGKIYHPIDRDSSSIVLKGLAPSTHAVLIRPRVGFWLDTNRVMEVFLDALKNSTNLTFPQGPPRPSTEDPSVPSGPDSTQALMPSSLSTLTQGVLYGERHADWTSQLELSHGSLDLNEFHRDSTASADSADEIKADVFRLRGSALAESLAWRPSASFEIRSENWSGKPALERLPTGDAATGWDDAEDAQIAIAPRWGGLDARAQAGMGRSSRMDDHIYWLPRFGASARADLPFGFALDAGASSRDEDATWEMLYRTNPARFRYASPDLQPRTDRGFQGTVAWSSGHLSLEAGLDRLQSDNAWLPRVLPGPGACASLADSAYGSLQSARCADSGGTAPAGTLPDSLALGLRNWSRETIDAWHLVIGLRLGHWSLDLRNRFVTSRSLDDAYTKTAMEDLSVPERVFKGRLGWRRDLLDGKMKLDLGWIWEWFSTRYAWAPDDLGESKVIKLDEYLALDFEADMKIKTFILYFRAKNLNHDRYATEPGVHPPGVNFRFGVDWTLWN